MSVVQPLRLAIQLLFLIGLTTSVLSGFMNVWPSILVAVFFLTIFCGNFYCGWLCPFGTVQELLGRLGSRLVGRKLVMSKGAQRWLRFSKYAIFALITANGALQFVAGFDAISPFNGNYVFMRLVSGGAASLQGATGALMLLYLAAYAVASLFFERPFCNYFCPDSIRYNLLSMARLVSVKRDAGRCIGCGKCSRSCPMQIDVAACGKVRSGSCINCMRCVSSCPVEGALGYRY